MYKVDSGGFSHPDDWIPHAGVSEAAARKCLKEGQVGVAIDRAIFSSYRVKAPPGHIVVRFTHPDAGCALLKEKDLILKDRALTVGDVVKKRASDAASGMVTKISTSCLLEPIYTELPYQGSESWPHKPEDNMLRAPAEELDFLDYESGDRIIYRDWMGEITDVYEEVIIKLDNNTIVKVDDPDALEIPDYNHEDSRLNPRGKRLNLSRALKQSRKYRSQTHKALNSKLVLGPPLKLYPGQIVFTTKANLRLGTWKVGSYDPNIPPRGVIVDYRVLSLHVEWIACKLYDNTRNNLAPPDELIEWPELDEVRLYNKNNLSSMAGNTSNQFGARQGHDMSAGDYVRFRDIAGAAVKYSRPSSDGSEHELFRRIPRQITQGFDMNVFVVKDTRTSAFIQWQDGLITEENSMNLIPYLTIDDHELWPGEIVSEKSAEVRRDDGVIDLNKVGVVQSVDANERTARVRWYSNSSVSILADRPSVLFSGADLGTLSDQESSASMYEVTAYPALTKRRGDLVVLAPNTEASSHTVSTLVQTTRNGSLPHMPDLGNVDLAQDPQDILSKTECRWFGEVVDLGLDGMLTVRLGALDHIEDIKVPIQRVFVAIGGDDPDFDSASENSEDSSRSGGLGEMTETFDYEGGERLDNGADDDWMTDDSDVEQWDDAMSQQDDTPETLSDKDIEMPDAPDSDIPEEVTIDESQPIRAPSSSSAEDPKLPIGSPDSQLQLAKYPNMPSQFMILDEGLPAAHHFLSSRPRLSANFLRRVRKEHAMLVDGLPEGIWVRTWSDRLDLLQVLILGPLGTPYELAPFLFDFKFNDDFPASAPEAYFHSWTWGVGRVNPNLYEDGKICLSVLGTWHHESEHEGWNASRSSLLQVIVSLLGLVLVEQPYYSMYPLLVLFIYCEFRDDLRHLARAPSEDR